MNQVAEKEQTAPKDHAPLDEVMLAMDVVDTLRHRELVLDRELQADNRDQRLLERLREVYTAQGITVSDDVLAQGVRALREDRFVYVAPAPSVSRALASIYVSRGYWGKWVGGAVAAAIVVVLAFQLLILGPKQRALEALPGELQSAYQTIVGETRDAGALGDAQQMSAEGQAAVGRRDYNDARKALADLRGLDARLEQQYELRVVSRPGERSGVWRVPGDNRRARNYYLIVQAIGPNGKALALPIKSEEDGHTRTVREWGLRVDESTYNRVAADKRDDGIIEHPIVGEKRAGELDPQYSVAATGAAITQW